MPQTIPKGPSTGARGRSRETQRSAEFSARTRQIFALLAVLLIAATLAGCGKKGAPQPPPDEPNTFPRSYPNV